MAHKLTAEQKFAKAKVGLVFEQPFFAGLALRLGLELRPPEWFASKKVPPTAATDGKNLYYCEQFVDTLSVAEVQGLLCHEALHVGMLHHTRRATRDLDRWQQATDYAVNNIIKDSKISLPDGALYDKKYSNMAAEEIYKHMQSQSPQNQQGQGGSGADFGSVLDSEGESAADKAAEEASWKSAMAAAAHQAKLAGKLPAGLERMVADMLEPKVDWGAQLREYLTDKLRTDDDWCRPNRRFAHRGMYLPTVREEPTGELVVAVDTSGSITDKVLAAFQTEIRTIASEVRPSKIIVIYCDAAINRVQEFEKDDTINLKMCGGGGTDFNPPFRYVAKENLQPHAFIYLTDGHGPFPNKPEYPVVWCMTTDVKAPFGHHVRVEIEEY